MTSEHPEVPQMSREEAVAFLRNLDETLLEIREAQIDLGYPNRHRPEEFAAVHEQYEVELMVRRQKSLWSAAMNFTDQKILKQLCKEAKVNRRNLQTELQFMDLDRTGTEKKFEDSMYFVVRKELDLLLSHVGIRGSTEGAELDPIDEANPGALTSGAVDNLVGPSDGTMVATKDTLMKKAAIKSTTFNKIRDAAGIRRRESGGQGHNDRFTADEVRKLIAAAPVAKTKGPKAAAEWKTLLQEKAGDSST